MKLLKVTLSIFILAGHVSAQASTNTNMLDAGLPIVSFHIETPEGDGSFLKRFKYEISHRAHDVSIDVFGYPASALWSLRFERGGYNIHNDVTSAGKDIFKRSFSYAAREAFVNGLPLEQWEDFGERLGNGILGKSARFLGYTIVDSIGNTDEERLNYVSPSPSAPVFENFNLENHSKDGSFRGGLRPWRSSPYLYMEKDIGHFSGKPALTLSLRCYSLLEDRDIGTLKMESQAVLPLSDSYYAVFGGSVYPSDMSSREKGPSASFLLAHSMRKRNGGTLLYAGAYSGPFESQVRVGISVYGPGW